MNDKLFEEIDGKSIIVNAFGVEHYEDKLIAKVEFTAEDRNSYFIIFENVSRLKLSEISYPFQICGFVKGIGSTRKGVFVLL